jgi:hypothetical protein
MAGRSNHGAASRRPHERGLRAGWLRAALTAGLQRRAPTARLLPWPSMRVLARLQVAAVLGHLRRCRRARGWTCAQRRLLRWVGASLPSEHHSPWVAFRCISDGVQSRAFAAPEVGFRPSRCSVRRRHSAFIAADARCSTEFTSTESRWTRRSYAPRAQSLFERQTRAPVAGAPLSSGSGTAPVTGRACLMVWSGRLGPFARFTLMTVRGGSDLRATST